MLFIVLLDTVRGCRIWHPMVAARHQRACSGSMLGVAFEWAMNIARVDSVRDPVENDWCGSQNAKS